jgi:ribosomal-protein-alanine N-acetyltransferase
VWDIVAFSTADIDPVVAIEKRSFLRPWGRISFLEELSCKQALNYVARSGDNQHAAQAIAYLCARLNSQEIYILKLAVDLEWRRKGIASQLLEKSLWQASRKSATTAILDVRRSNRPAIELYQKHGFHPVGIRPEYYTDTGEGALVMRKHLRSVRPKMR